MSNFKFGILFFLIQILYLRNNRISALNANTSKTLTKIAFGSCSGMMKSISKVFKTLTDYDPELFIWLGDTAYVDEVPFKWNPWYWR